MEAIQPPVCIFMAYVFVTTPNWTSSLWHECSFPAFLHYVLALVLFLFSFFFFFFVYFFSYHVKPKIKRVCKHTHFWWRWTSDGTLYTALVLNVKGVRDGKFYFQQIDFMMITLFPSWNFVALYACFNPIACANITSSSIPSGWISGCLRSISTNKGNNKKCTKAKTKMTTRKNLYLLLSSQNDCIWDVTKAHAHLLIPHYAMLFIQVQYLVEKSQHIQSSRVIIRFVVRRTKKRCLWERRRSKIKKEKKIDIFFIDYCSLSVCFSHLTVSPRLMLNK